AVIDHHPDSGRPFDYKEIRSAYGSCATLVFQMLSEEGFDVNADLNLATALYYGLYTDTNSLSEIAHPADKDLRDDSMYNKSLVHALRNANLSAAEIAVAGEALKQAVFYENQRFAVAEAGPCDPNILGFISDMLLQVNLCDSCVVFCRLPFGVKFSVRSCVPEIHAGEMAGSLSEAMGSGGGHNEKAGGFINESALSEFFSSEKKRGDADFFRDRMIRYLQSFDILYSTDFEPDHAAMATFIKLRVPLGYVRSLDVLAEGDSATVRTLEGDINIRASEDIYIMIGISGEVYPIKRPVFEKRYVATTDPYKASFEYAPTVKRTDTQQSVPLLDFAFVCVPSEETRIFARPLDRTVKVFTAWDPDHYMLGKPGDQLATHCENPKDVYVIARDIFEKTYRPADTEPA
ncbi:MAG: recombinase RecJ, partial [Clostridiales bacterium]|nr:recombinase RecJ [Clostridiales bacterium]